MVKIAVPGGTGRIAAEIIDVLSATKKHEIMIISRKAPSAVETRYGVTWALSDYTDKEQLIGILRGVHTILSFASKIPGGDNAEQKMLVEASIAAGVTRFAPNEWSTNSIEGLPWYAPKVEMREWLAILNKDKKVIEYTLFQPGLLVDYVTPPGTNKHLEPPELFIDFENRRVMVIDGMDGYGTFTTMKDIANVVAGAVEYPGEWPVVGGIRGTNMPISELINIGIKARGGKPWAITSLKEEDVVAGEIKASWHPTFEAPTMTSEEIAQYAKIILAGSLFSIVKNTWVVSDEWNKLLPDYKFDNVEEYLVKSWAGKP